MPEFQIHDSLFCSDDQLGDCETRGVDDEAEEGYDDGDGDGKHVFEDVGHVEVWGEFDDAEAEDGGHEGKGCLWRLV